MKSPTAEQEKYLRESCTHTCWSKLFSKLNYQNERDYREAVIALENSEELPVLARCDVETEEDFKSKAEAGCKLQKLYSDHVRETYKEVIVLKDALEKRRDSFLKFALALLAGLFTVAKVGDVQGGLAMFLFATTIVCLTYSILVLSWSMRTNVYPSLPGAAETRDDFFKYPNPEDRVARSIGMNVAGIKAIEKIQAFRLNNSIHAISLAAVLFMFFVVAYLWNRKTEKETTPPISRGVVLENNKGAKATAAPLEKGRYALQGSAESAAAEAAAGLASSILSRVSP